MRGMGYQTLGVLLSLAGLHGVYRLIETSWPASYFSLADYSAYRKTIHPLGYLLFRFGPVFVVTLFLAVSLQRGDQPVWPATLIMLAGHVTITHGRAAASVWPETNDPRRSPLVALHLVASASLVGVGVLAALLRVSLSPLIPPLDSLAGELWGAAIAGAFGAYLVNRTQTTSLDEATLIERARQRIAPGLIQLARDEAERNGADPDLVEAILITEDLQRPRWFRTLERVKSIVFRDGTYGIMQVRHRGAVSDAESIRIATAGALAGQQVPLQASGDYRFLDTEALRTQLHNYNRSSTWINMLVDILQTVRPPD